MTETSNAPRDALDRTLRPETILPAQFADLLRGAAAILPEHRLMLAVLEDAIRCYQIALGAGGRRSWRRFRETEAWFGAPASRRLGVASLRHPAASCAASSALRGWARRASGPRPKGGKYG